MRVRLYNIGTAVLFLFVVGLCPSSGFSCTRYSHQSGTIRKSRSRSIALSNSAVPIAPYDATIEDKNGKTIKAGSIVRVIAKNLKAHQVPVEARGSFNDEKQFVPVRDDAPRAQRNLEVPIGMRGVVIKIINKTARLSANFPIQVQFTPGENTEEGYDSPAPFVMHFGADEIEAV